MCPRGMEAPTDRKLRTKKHHDNKNSLLCFDGTLQRQIEYVFVGPAVAGDSLYPQQPAIAPSLLSPCNPSALT